MSLGISVVPQNCKVLNIKYSISLLLLYMHHICSGRKYCTKENFEKMFFKHFKRFTFFPFKVQNSVVNNISESHKYRMTDFFRYDIIDI